MAGVVGQGSLKQCSVVPVGPINNSQPPGRLVESKSSSMQCCSVLDSGSNQRHFSVLQVSRTIPIDAWVLGMESSFACTLTPAHNTSALKNLRCMLLGWPQVLEQVQNFLTQVQIETVVFTNSCLCQAPTYTSYPHFKPWSILQAGAESCS